MKADPNHFIKLPARGKSPTYRLIVEAIRQKVDSGKLLPNQKLPAHVLLAQQLQVNPTTVRRAYELLDNQGIIIRKHGSGTFVAPGALRLMQQATSRPIGRILAIAGTANLSSSPRHTMFIGARIFDGFYEVMDGRASPPCYYESLTMDLARSIQPDDIVLLKYHTHIDPAAVRYLLENNTRVVAMLDAMAVSGVPRVSYELHQAVSLACDHLIEKGYKRIGYLGSKKHWTLPVNPKFAAFARTITDAALDLCGAHVLETDSTPGSAYASMHRMLKSGNLPDAFFIDTDYKAMEAIRALGEAGIAVPQNLGVVAYDDILESAAFSPALTTVHTPITQIGKATAQLILEWEDTSQTPADITLPAHLVVRDSLLDVAELVSLKQYTSHENDFTK